MAEILFPARQKCKKCSKRLGATVRDAVLLGLYCSPKCAGMANPPTSPEDAPRECTTVRDGQKAWKRRYRSESEIPDKIRDDVSSSFYWCGSCGHMHSGHSRMGEAEQFRKTRSRADVADLFVKLRGAAKHSQVAEVAGIRAIRIKEIEDPKHKQVLLADVLALAVAYGVDLGFVLGGAHARASVSSPVAAAPPSRAAARPSAAVRSAVSRGNGAARDAGTSFGARLSDASAKKLSARATTR